MTAMAVVVVGPGKFFHPADPDSIVLISGLKFFGDPVLLLKSAPSRVRL